MRGLFDLRSGDDLCAKLEHDYARVCSDPADAFSGFDFVVTSWHLLEWRYPGNGARAQREELCLHNPILRVCEHLAVGAKHFEPRDPKLDAVAETHRDAVWARGVWAPGTWAPGVWKDDLVVRLDGAAKDALGESLTMKQIADLVMAFWKAEGRCPPMMQSGGPQEVAT